MILIKTTCVMFTYILNKGKNNKFNKVTQVKNSQSHWSEKSSILVSAKCN